ncbi:hypothetical protein CUMW_248970 [Citrus unshiu]|nr:hypothetical protein CUMW_248970 [Citrus unshiu]
MWAFILAGEIPTEMGNLKNLEYLALNSNNLTAENHFTGHLPPTIGHSLPNMDWLSLAKNKLSGTIPNSITNASKLRVLDLSYNSFSGLIPSTFGNLRFLGVYYLTTNHLLIGNFRGLIPLSLSNNDLDGTIPASMGTLKTLQVSYLDANNLQGCIPCDLCVKNKMLSHLLSVKNKMLSHLLSYQATLES